MAGDDEHNTLMWSHLMKECAYYYDVPNIDDEVKMKRTLQRKYDQLFEDGWRAPLTSRRDLLTWACGQYNKTLVARDIPAEDMVPCDNYAFLLEMFGPDYNKIKPKVGYIRGLFD